MTHKPRAAAVKVLLKVCCKHQSLSDALSGIACNNPSLMRELCYGVLRFYPRLDFLVKNFCHKPFKAKDQDIHLLACLGIYEILYLNTPAHAAVSETVQTCLQFKKAWAKNLINAILRKVLRETDQCLALANSDAIAHSAHPAWLLQTLQHDWPQHWPQIIAANNQRPPLVLRVNQQKTSVAEYLDQLNAQNIQAKAIDHLAQAIVLAQAVDVHDLPGFDAGWVSVQDGSAQLAAALLKPPAGARVLDACAAPGGKTCHLLESQPDLEQIIALDNQASRLVRIQENLQRLHLNAEVVCADAADLPSWWDGQAFSHILLDAPCSATGVIRRHPDIKLLRRADDIAKLAQQQSRLLSALWNTLANDGLLLYATCSVLQRENEQVIAEFLQQRTDARCMPLSHPAGMQLQHGLQILPGSHGMDGFYYCSLLKK